MDAVVQRQSGAPATPQVSGNMGVQPAAMVQPNPQGTAAQANIQGAVGGAPPTRYSECHNSDNNLRFKQYFLCKRKRTSCFR